MHPRKQVGTRHLTVRYLLILSVLAALALANCLILRAEIEVNRRVAAVVSKAGQQRSLLQHTALLSQKLVSSEGDQRVREELMANIIDLESQHEDLVTGSAARPLPPAAQMIYFNEPWLLDQAIRSYAEQVRALAQLPPQEMSWQHPYMQYIDEAALSGVMLEGLNKIVAAYQTRGEQRIRFIENFAIWSFIGTLAFLVLSGILIFRPMVRHVNSDMQALAELNDNLEQRVAQRAREAEHRAAELVISEGALRDQSRVLSSILEYMGDGVMVLDSEAKFQLLNPKARSILNVKPDQALPVDWSNDWLDQFGVLLYQADGSEPLPMDSFPLIRSLRGEEVDRAQICVVRDDGKVTWLSITSRPLRDSAGRVSGSVAVLRDTTERKRSEDALRKSEMQYRSLVDNLPLYVLRKDIEGRFTWVNENFCRLVDQSFNQVIGKTDFDFFTPEQAEKNRADDQHVMDRGIVFHDIEVHSTPTGEKLHLEVLKTPVRNAAGEIVETQTILLDVTSRVEAERRVVQTERLAAIGQMVTGVAHESRNALQQIQACCGLLQWKLNGRAEVSDLIEDLQKAQDRLRRLFDDLRGYAGPVKLDRRKCNLIDIIVEAWKSLEPLRQNRDATLKLDSTVEQPCHVDTLQIEQVFRNVLENALAACHDPVLIEVCFPPKGDHEKTVHVEIRDNGPGLTPEQHLRAFEPFYTTKSKGTGLGMAITKRIVEAHDGQIEIGNAPGGGAIVSIALPRGET